MLAAQAAPPPFSEAVKAGMAAQREGRNLRARDLFADAAFGPDGKVRDEMAFQIWMQASAPLTGELPLDAMERRRDVSPPDADWTTRIRRATARDAVAEIVRRARLTSIVILNEAHYSPRDRAFALEVARALRPLGYNVLAAEAFNNATVAGKPNAMSELVSDGIVRKTTGSYTDDPVFAAYVRQALAIGYRPVAYEQTNAQRPEGSGIPAREAAQTDNLMAAIFARDPKAKVLIHVGHSHVAEAPIPGRNDAPTEWMAARLKRATGIDPLTIDQTELTDLWPAMRDAYPIAAAKAGQHAAVLFDGDRPLVLGQYAGAVDLQVVHPARRYRDGRPSWVATLGGRAVAVPNALLPAHGERLIRAYAADAPTDAVPLDQVLVTAGQPAPKLMLPAVRVRFATEP